MPSGVKKSQREFSHFWHLQEWMKTCGKRQADLSRELGWSKGKAHDVWHSQQYTQSLIDELAPWLNLEPYELLMEPERAMALRRLRETAAKIASDTVEEKQRPRLREAG